MDKERESAPVEKLENMGNETLPREIYGLVGVIVKFLSDANRAWTGKEWSKEVAAGQDP
ncbi:MAG: hypothetical protein M1269_03685 [Chloroflexi bacterium]|nr:hypothetical protein [Chloroflexota bacterium]